MVKQFFQVILGLVLLASQGQCQSEVFKANKLLVRIDQEVREAMDQGDIPGVSLVIVTPEQELIRSYGYADMLRKEAISATSLFEIASCSKAFAALVVTHLHQQAKIDLQDPISEYIPWFSVFFEGKEVPITLKQLLYHTGGIPWSTIAQIPASELIVIVEEVILNDGNFLK